AEIDLALAVQLRREAAVLRLALLGNVHFREDLEDVDDALAHRPAERLGGVQDAVDPQADAHVVAGRLQVDVGGAALDGVPDHLQGGLVALAASDAGQRRLVFLHAIAAAADEADT